MRCSNPVLCSTGRVPIGLLCSWPRKHYHEGGRQCRTMCCNDAAAGRATSRLVGVQRFLRPPCRLALANGDGGIDQQVAS
ncbi:hypothetical protein RB3693 [Rhodopirellula baltica SH 1]|uniref:Uncharacterized protein n=1 Tax=Rhodopirellula baltica (strain DSM 10527 / NCIMB 13988 / SH1) TaxID=243090 RepID=Q7UTT4_RHOBA|nr:hypothetical protein RB3693 [Rhodopirellula baltica SH 1]